MVTLEAAQLQTAGSTAKARTSLVTAKPSLMIIWNSVDKINGHVAYNSVKWYFFHLFDRCSLPLHYRLLAIQDFFKSRFY